LLAQSCRYHDQPEDVSFFGAAEVYYATVKEMNSQIDWFLKELDKLGLSQNTLVLFPSENCPEDFQIRNTAHSGVGSAGPFRGRKRSRNRSTPLFWE